MITQEDKIYFNIHTALYHQERQTEDDIVYTRTDTFIEKACSWLNDNAIKYWGTEFVDNGEMVEDFRNYMKGE